MNFFEDRQDVPDNAVYDHGFKVQWEQFLRHFLEEGSRAYTLA